ncbi:FliM/FliN family flagellar motor switch protein [Chromobacterium phragmitis]|nr:FliM/FliN family flagellar motor switch protein [Chromobacterium phragmitis]
MVEPIRDLLSSTMQADRTEVDNRWVNLMTHQVQAAEVELVASLAHAKVTLGQILNLKNGDVVMIDIPERVEADVSGIPVFEASYGTVQGRYALKVEKILAGTNEFLESPGEHEQ